MKCSGSYNGGLSFSVYNLLSQTLSLSPSLMVLSQVNMAVCDLERYV